MSARLRGIAGETERIVASGGWTTRDGRRIDLAAAIASAAAGTRLYGPEPVPVPEWTPVAATEFEVTGEGSLDAARRVAGDGPVAVLDFASARNPGGGYLTAPRPRRRRSAGARRCTGACARRRSTTRPTGRTPARSTATG